MNDRVRDLISEEVAHAELCDAIVAELVRQSQSETSDGLYVDVDLLAPLAVVIDGVVNLTRLVAAIEAVLPLRPSAA